MIKTTIVNKYKRKYQVYIGRPSIYGNPFEITEERSREESVALYKIYFYNRISSDEDFKNKVLTLRGKVLGCFCKPKICHGDVICEYLNNL